MSKRALIVDDSRSARVILGRMLEGYGLTVDSCESAEQSLEYLRQTRPDVIFMDHLMPGMDGFQAVQAIKANPQTASIPVLMYTSQEGEMYVSQARALGALGVLPKTVKQADVSRVLFQLRLVPERRQSVMPEAANDDVAPVTRPAAAIRPAPGEIETAIRAAVAPLLQEHAADLRRQLLAAIETAARRPAEPVTPALEPAPAAEAATVPAEKPIARWPLAAALAGLALLVTLVLAGMHVRTLNSAEALARHNQQLLAMVAQQETQLSDLRKELRTRAEAASVTPVGASTPTSELVPYGEAPLSGTRLERLRTMIEDLWQQGFRGTITVSTYVGEFCLTGNAVEGYSLATDDTPYKRCDVVGNPFEDNLSAAQRQSVAFANFIDSLTQTSGQSVRVEVVHEGRKPRIAYPEGDALSKASAGEWNKIASQNNRVEFAIHASI